MKFDHSKSYTPHFGKQHRGIETSAGTLIVIVILVAAAGVMFSQQISNFVAGKGFTSGNIAGTGNGSGSSAGCPIGTQTVTKKIAFSNSDPLGGSAVASGTYVTYINNVQLESLGAAADSTVTSAQTYPSNQFVQTQISASSYVTQFGGFNTPCMSPADAQSSSTNNVKFYEIKLGSWSATITGTSGTTLSTGQTYHFSTGVGSTSTLALTVAWAESTTNAGYLGCSSANQVIQYDFLNRVCRHLLMEVSDTASSPKLTVTGLQRLFTIGNSKYWDTVLPDGLCTTASGAISVIGTPACSGIAMNDPGDSVATGSLSFQTIGNTNYGGNAVTSFNVAAGGLTTTNTENLAIKLFYYADPNYFATNLNYGPQATQSGSTITITFTVS